MLVTSYRYVRMRTYIQDVLCWRNSQHSLVFSWCVCLEDNRLSIYKYRQCTLHSALLTGWQKSVKSSYQEYTSVNNVWVFLACWCLASKRVFVERGYQALTSLYLNHLDADLGLLYDTQLSLACFCRGNNQRVESWVIKSLQQPQSFVRTPTNRFCPPVKLVNQHEPQRNVTKDLYYSQFSFHVQRIVFSCYGTVNTCMEFVTLNHILSFLSALLSGLGHTLGRHIYCTYYETPVIHTANK